MKVIFVSREGHDLPGARIRCYNFAKRLANHNIVTEVLSYSDTLGAKDGEEESQMGLREKIRYNWKAFKSLVTDKEAILYIQRFNYHAFAPYLAHLFNKNRIILDLDDWEMRDDPKYLAGIYPTSKAHYFTRQIAKRSLFCIAASRFLEQFLRQFHEKVHYIPSGVDTELFRPSLNGLDRNRIVFCWIGTFHRKEYIENIKFALDCFSMLRKRYNHIYLDIVGDGIYKDDLIAAVSGFNDSNIRLKGWISPDQVPAYLENIHIGLLPVASDTKFNRAKSPTKLFEYMAMEKPTVSSYVGEAGEIIQDGMNGLFAKTKEEFTKKMQILIEDCNLRNQIGKKARASIIENYSLEILGKRLYEIIKQI